MTDIIANQNGGVKPQDTNASGPSSTGTGTGTGSGTPNIGLGKSQTDLPKRRPPKKRQPKKNPNNKPDSATSNTGNENTVNQANSEVGNATAEGSKKTRNKNKKRRKNKKNLTDGAGDANATEVAGEKKQEPQKDDPRGTEGKLSRTQRRKLKTSQGGSVSGTGTVDNEIAATGSQPESGVLLAGAPAESVTTTQGPGEKEQNMIEMLDGEPRGKDGKLSRKQRRLLRETMTEEAESSESAPIATETTTTEAANHAKLVLETLETLEASLSAPETPVPALEEETTTANRDIAFDKMETSADNAKTAAPKKEEKAETKTKAASRDLVVETQKDYKAKTIAYEDDNTGKKDDCECSVCIIS